MAGGVACLNFNTLTSLLDKLSISSVFAELGKAVKILPEMKHLPTNRVRSSRHSNLSCTQPLSKSPRWTCFEQGLGPLPSRSPFKLTNSISVIPVSYGAIFLLFFPLTLLKNDPTQGNLFAAVAQCG